MIPTRHRAKLPRHLSYPVGAQAISDALAGAPHFEALSVAFRDQAVWPASEFRRLLTERSPYTILEAMYHPASSPGISGSDSMVRSGWYDERWELRVNPVLSEFRSAANRRLREEGLPAVAAWLKSSDRAGWTMTWRWIELIFNPADESLSPAMSSGV